MDKKKYNVSRPENEICFREKSILIGYGSDLYFYVNCSKTSGGLRKYNYNLPSNNRINEGNGLFLVLNYGVYHIEC